jgi:ABC-type metal ion transport system substrate-binding protein
LIYFYENKEWELYDLKKDQSEMKNVYNDASYAKVVKMMKEKLIQLKNEYKDTEPATIDINENPKKAF